jgi:hypothetical protein
MAKPGCSPAPHDPLATLLVKAAEQAEDDAVRRWLAALARGDAAESAPESDEGGPR